MKLLASFLSLTLIAALSAWLWLGQGTGDAEAEGVDLTSAASSVGSEVVDTSPIPGDSVRAQVDSVPGLTDQHAAAFVGLQTLLDVWQNQPRTVLADSDLLADAVREARGKVESEIAAKAEQEKAEREEAEREEAERRSSTPQTPRQVSPRPVSPDCEWDDGEWECDDDDDWDDDDDDDDDDWDDDDR